MISSGRERYVVLGLGPSRAPWFVDLARWATGAAVPIELVKCVSVGELRAQLDSNRRFSAVVLDGGLPGIDRDLLARAAGKGCVALVVDNPRVPRDWPALGAAATLPGNLRRADLLSALERHAQPVDHVPATASPGDGRSPDEPAAPLIALTGAGGTGVSVLAMALAQALSTPPTTRPPRRAADERSAQGPLLLADFARRADHALLHDAGEIGPGVQELTDAHSVGRPPPSEIHALTYAAVERGYRLLLGLRRPRDWVALRPRAFEAALDSLLALHTTVVADFDHDIEGEAETGSVDVEDRNLMARTVVARADVIFVVGVPGPTGLANIVRLTTQLQASQLARGLIIPVVNRAPRNPRARAMLARALAELRPSGATALAHGAAPIAASPVFVNEQRRLDETLHDAVRLPDTLGAPLAAACQAALQRRAAPGDHGHERDPVPVPVKPGSLGSWSDTDD